MSDLESSRLSKRSFEALTGSSSLISALREIFDRRFGAERIATGGELTSNAHGLASIGTQANPGEWAT